MLTYVIIFISHKIPRIGFIITGTDYQGANAKLKKLTCIKQNKTQSQV